MKIRQAYLITIMATVMVYLAMVIILMVCVSMVRFGLVEPGQVQLPFWMPLDTVLYLSQQGLPLLPL